MSRFWKLSAIALAAVVALTPLASAQQRQVQQQIIVRRVFVAPLYDPFFYDPFYSPYRSVYVPPATGDVKFKTNIKEAALYVDGGYAGELKKNKRIHLPPGTHKIELRNSDGVVMFSRKVNVLLGRTTELEIGHRG